MGLGRCFCLSRSPERSCRCRFFGPAASVTHSPSPWSSERVSGPLTGQDSQPDSADWPRRTPHRGAHGPQPGRCPVPSGLSLAELNFSHALWDFILDLQLPGSLCLCPPHPRAESPWNWLFPGPWHTGSASPLPLLPGDTWAVTDSASPVLAYSWVLDINVFLIH